MTIAYNPGGLGKGLEKLDTALFGLEQFRDAVQEGKVVGIDLNNFAYHRPFQVIKKTEYPGTLSAAEMEMAEVETWLQSLNKKYEPMTKEEIEEFLATSVKESKTEKKIGEVEKEKEAKTETAKISDDKSENNKLNGTAWNGTLESMSGGDEEKRTIDFDFVLNEDGTVTGNNFKKWTQDGDRIKLFGEDESLGYIEFKVGENDLQLTKMLIGDELIQPGERYMGGIAPAGFIYKKSNSDVEEGLQSTGDTMTYSDFNEMSDNGEFKNIAMVTEKLGEPDVKTTDDRGRIIYIYYDLVKYDSGSLGSVKMSFYDEDAYKSYIKNMGASWESNKENWDVSGGGIKASEEIRPKDTFKSIYGE